MTGFKGERDPKSVNLYAVFFYVRHAVSHRDFWEIWAERGVKVDHATLNRWAVKFSPQLVAQAHERKRLTVNSRRMAFGTGHQKREIVLLTM